MITAFWIFILALSCQAAKMPSLEIEVNATDHQYQSISWEKYNSLNVITPVEIVKSLKTILNAQTRDMYHKLWFFMQILER